MFSKFKAFNKPPGFLSDGQYEKKINTEKTTKASLSRESSVFIPGFQGLFLANPNNEGNSLKEETRNKPQNAENNNRYMSCPATPDYNKTENNKGLNSQKNYDLFEKRTLFSEDFKRKFENLQISKVLEKFVNNFFLEENIKKMKKEDIEKFDFLTMEEKAKVNGLLDELRGSVDA